MITPLTLPSLRRRAEDEAAGLPALLAAAERAANELRSGDHRHRRPGAGESFWQFRDYHAGDRPQDIDWRASGRGDRVLVRQKEKQSAQTMLLWCAGGAGMDYRSASVALTKRQSGLILSLALALLMSEAGEQVGMLDGARPGRGEAALERLGQGLIDTPPHTLPGPSPVPAHAGLVLAGDFLETPELIVDSLAPLAARTERATLIQILDPSELTLPFTGRVVFEGSNNAAERHHIASVEAVRAEYRARIDGHIEALRTLCRRHGWHHILHRTDAPLRDTLAQAWAAIAPEGRI